MSFHSEFENYLPLEVLAKSVKIGNEYAIPYPEVLEAIQIATGKEIAILGVEVFIIVEDGLQCDRFSGYDFELEGEWVSFVRTNNDHALREIDAVAHHSATRFVLTTASKSEYQELCSASFRARLGLRPAPSRKTEA